MTKQQTPEDIMRAHLGMVVTPRNDKVVLLIDPVEEVSAGGIHLGHGAHEREQLIKATVLAVGPGKLHKGKRIPCGCRVGARVLLNRKWGRLNLTDPVRESTLGTEVVIVDDGNVECEI